MESRLPQLTPDQISPEELVVHLTKKCPLACSHCCVSSDIYQIETLTFEQVKSFIVGAQEWNPFKMVSFVGGDPFIVPRLLEKCIKFASEINLAAAAVTSAFWATSLEKAERILSRLVTAGLRLLTISYDDFHAPHVRQSSIVNAFRAARTFHCKVRVAVVVQPGCLINKQYIVRLLDLTGDEKKVVYETGLTSTGRAAENADEDVLELRRSNPTSYRGPCLSVLRQITLLSDGTISACCGVAPKLPPLIIGSVADLNFRTMMGRAYDDGLLQWIAFEGPPSILEQITVGSARPFKQSQCDGVCDACVQLLGTDQYRSLLLRSLEDKGRSLQLQKSIYSATGKLVQII